MAGLAGITAQYLSVLERGLCGFNRHGLIEDLAEALGCAVADLTGQPYLLIGVAMLHAWPSVPTYSG